MMTLAAILFFQNVQAQMLRDEEVWNPHVPALTLQRPAALSWDLFADPDFNKDTDGDGIPDRLDWDLDSDGVANCLDRDPSDGQHWGTDLDGDGLLDHLDILVHGRLSPLHATAETAPLQKDFLDQTRITAFEKSAIFTSGEWLGLLNAFTQGPLKNMTRMGHLKCIVKDGSLDRQGRTLGQYHRYWQVISVPSLQTQNERGESIDLAVATDQSLSTLFHEIAHALAEDMPLAYREFYTSMGWTVEAPSDTGRALRTQYQFQGQSFTAWELKEDLDKIDAKIKSADFPNAISKGGPAEMWAECFAASLAAIRNPDFKNRGFAEPYLRSKAHQWMLNLFRRL